MKSFLSFKTISARQGFSTLELVIAMSILAAVTLAVLKLYNMQHKVTHIEQEVVEVQRSLRAAVGRIARDVRIAGFATDADPVSAVGNDTGLNSSDVLTITTASAFMPAAVIFVDQTVVVSSGVDLTFTVSNPSDAGFFTAGDIVRIIDPSSMDQPVNTSFTVTAVNTATPSVTLNPVSSSSSTLFRKGGLIVKTGSGAPDTFPNTITYCLGPAPSCAPAATACPAGTTCLMRLVNNTPSGDSVVARGISDVQFQYLQDGSSGEVDSPTNLPAVRAVKFMLNGQTVRTAGLSGGAKAREVYSMAYIRNR